MFAGIMRALPGAVTQGVIWGIMALGVYLTFRVLKISDLTVDGSFATGGAVSAVLVANGLNPVLALIVATVAGLGCGFCTGILHTRLKIPPILSGILTMIGLYSINLRIMGKSNIPLLNKVTVTSALAEMIKIPEDMATLILGILFSIIIIAGLYWFFGTEIGCAIRATGSNENMVRSQGISTDATKVLGLAISNSLVSLSGGLVAQSQGYAAVDMGTGAIMIGLASIIIGEVIMGTKFSFAYKMSSIVIGSVLYRIIIAVVLQLGMRSTDMKLLTAIMVAIAMGLPVLTASLKEQRQIRKASTR